MKKICTHFEEIISSSAFAIMLLAVSVNVVSRYMFSKSFAWTEEIAYMAFTYVVFFGACAVYKRQGMIAIDVVVDHLPRKIQKGCQIATYFLLSIGNATMVYYSYRLTAEAWVRSTANLRIPYAYIDVSAFIAFIFLTFYSLRFLYWTIINHSLENTALEDRS